MESQTSLVSAPVWLPVEHVQVGDRLVAEGHIVEGLVPGRRGGVTLTSGRFGWHYDEGAFVRVVRP